MGTLSVHVLLTIEAAFQVRGQREHWKPAPRRLGNRPPDTSNSGQGITSGTFRPFSFVRSFSKSLLSGHDASGSVLGAEGKVWSKRDKSLYLRGGGLLDTGDGPCRRGTPFPLCPRVCHCGGPSRSPRERARTSLMRVFLRAHGRHRREAETPERRSGPGTYVPF